MLHDQEIPSPEGFSHRLTISGPERTKALGRAVARMLAGGEIILLYGPLGAGKTCFCQGLCSGLKVNDEVVSPTFTLVNTYTGGDYVVHHLDFYRVGPEHDLNDIGVPDILDEVFSGQAVVLIEWPEPILPELGGLESRVELLALPGRDSDERIWHLRGVPDVPESWIELFDGFPATGE